MATDPQPRYNVATCTINYQDPLWREALAHWLTRWDAAGWRLVQLWPISHVDIAAVLRNYVNDEPANPDGPPRPIILQVTEEMLEGGLARLRGGDE